MRSVGAIQRLLMTLLIAVTAFAAAAAEPFIDATTLDLVRFIPPPPADDSPQTRRDLAEMLAIQETRTAAMVDHASTDVEQDVWRFTNALPTELQSRFNAESLPHLAPFVERLRATKSAVVDPAKKTWKRPRPYLLSSQIKPAIKLEVSQSWPSGHATIGMLMAIVLADMLPEHRAAFFRRADDYARSRVVGGVHYPSDLVAGLAAGALIAAELQHDAAFRAEYAVARDEVRRVLRP